MYNRVRINEIASRNGFTNMKATTNQPVFSRRVSGRALTAQTRSRLALTILSLVLLSACSHWRPASLGTSTAFAVAPDGVPIAYSVAGRGEVALVFIHGWSCDRTYWAEQVPYFARTMTVITLDLAGHGDSGRTQRVWTIQNFATDVATVVKAVGARRVVLIGHSLGGPVAAEAALLLPDETVAVIGVDTFYDFWSTAAFTDVLDSLRADFSPATRDFVRGVMFTPRSDPVLVAQIAEAMAAAPPEIAIPALEDLQHWTRDRFAPALGSLQVPLGVLQALTAGYSMLERQRTSLPALEIESIPGTGHFLMLEHPKKFNARLDSLLRQVRGRAAH